MICLSGCRKGLIPSLVAKRRYPEAEDAAVRLRDAFGAESFYIELQNDLTPGYDQVNRQLAQLADQIGVRVVATNNVHYATPTDFVAHDILRCINAGCKREEAHPDRPLNAERYLKGAAEMAELFAWRPDALANTLRIADQCEHALPKPEDVTPRYPVPEAHRDAAAYLRHLVYKGAVAKYRDCKLKIEPGADDRRLTIDDKSESQLPIYPFTQPPSTIVHRPLSLTHHASRIIARIEHELSIICKLGYADYFLMCWEIVRWARKQGIRATGRGSAADSCVAYCLTLTDVDVIQRNLPFARFLAEGKTPDIDIDFPSERRDDVFQYIIQKYGEAHVGMVCTFHTYWAKSAVRDIGKVLSIPHEALSWLSDNLSGFIRADQVEEAFGRFAELRPWTSMKDRFKLLFELSGKIAGFPRHIGTHSSGIVISRVPLGEIAPLQPSARGITQIWELDKDDAEMLGAIKFDVLALRMLSAVGDAEKSISDFRFPISDLKNGLNLKSIHDDTATDKIENPKSKIQNPKWAYDRIPFGDEETFRMMRAGKAVGAFQFESAAQMSLATTLNPEHFEDLVAAVALIRPGPIQGHVVQRFVACRNGWMKADVLHPCLEITLAKTYGCIVFQEQVNDVVAAMTGCSDAEADKFRKSITQHTKQGTMQQLREEFVRKSCAYRRDFNEERANKLFDQIQGWAGYGFTEGHAASFTLTGYRTAYLTVHHPAEIYSGMMNHQPMGFFSANTLAGEARRRGVPVLPVDINESEDKCVVVRRGGRLQ